MTFETPIDLLREASKKIVFPRILNPSSPLDGVVEAMRNGTVGMRILPKNMDVSVQSITDEEDQRILDLARAATEYKDG